MRFDELQLLPRSLDYTTVAQQLPGTNAEAKLGGLSVDGSSASENRFIIDGIDTTDMMKGLPGQGLNINSVEEIQVKSSGPRPKLRRNLQDASKAEYITYPEDPYRALDPGFSLGGLIRKDNAWFFVSYQPLLRHTERTVTFALDGSSGTFAENFQRHFLTASQSLQFGAKLRTRAAFSAAPSVTDGWLPSQSGSDTPVANFDMALHQPNGTASFSADYMTPPQTLISGRIGYDYWNQYTQNVRSGPLFTFNRPNIGFLDVPVSLQRMLGFKTETNNSIYLRSHCALYRSELLRRFGLHFDDKNKTA
jgi:hypothetical protein